MTLLGTIATEGNELLARQAEVNRPVVATVGEISNTLADSEFAHSVQGGVASVAATGPNLVSDKVSKQQHIFFGGDFLTIYALIMNTYTGWAYM